MLVHMNLHDRDITRAARKEGIELGMNQKAIEATINLLKMGLGTPEQISQAQGLPLEKVLELQKSIPVQAQTQPLGWVECLGLLAFLGGFGVVFGTAYNYYIAECGVI